MNEKHHHSGNGFIVGIVVGVLLTLLFTTKKGRRILKTLSEEGMESLGDVLDFNIEDEMTDEILQEEGLPEDDKSEPGGKKRLFKNLRKK